MAHKKSSKTINQQKKKRASSKKLTQAEVEARIIRRADAVQDKVRRLEQSQIVTQGTMLLEFQPLVSSKYAVQVEKPS